MNHYIKNQALMKNRNTRINFIMVMSLIMLTSLAWGQKIQYFRPYDQRGINVFETSKEDSVGFDGVKVRIGANFKQQYQNLKHSNEADEVLALPGTPNEFDQNKLVPIGGGFNLAMANLNLDFQLADGVRVNLVTYLSSRHHPETWVKSGYFQIDKVSFLNSEFMDNLWKNLTLKIGHMEINYGDQHYRRSDGGNGMYNPFVENYLMDAFTTEIGAELYWQKNGILAMVAITDGEIQGNVTRPDDRSPSFYGKVGVDKNLRENLRVRLTGSFYTTNSSISNTLYSGDRTGSHYYMVTEPEYYLSSGVKTATSVSNRFTSGRLNPGFRDAVQSFMINPFVKAGGFEFFGTYEMSTGRASNETKDREYSQYAAEGLYRFAQDKLYIGARYNRSEGEEAFGDVSVDRTAIAGGWFLTKNVLFKVEYVNQNYNDYPSTDIRHNMKVDGFVIEGIVGF
jgi:hypothetical protein